MNAPSLFRPLLRGARTGRGTGSVPARVLKVVWVSALLAGATVAGSSAPPTSTPARASASAASVTAAAPATTLNVVAHADDDILFINPDISRDIAAGRRVVTVFASAGDAGKTVRYWRGREAGAMAAYAAMARARNRWTTSRLTVAGHPITRATLSGKPITLLFLRLPDGHGYPQHNFEAMHQLWKGTLGTIHAIDGSTSYTKASLTQTLTAVMDRYRPTVIRTLDYAGHYGDGDHGDHHSAAYFTLAAHRDYRTPHTLTGYLGYPAQELPVNLPNRARDTKLGVFLAYARHDPHVCATRKACLGNFYAGRFARWHLSATELGGGRNIAPAAQVTASSGAGTAAHAVDGTVTGPASRHWVAAEAAGGWIQLDWTTPQTINRVVLYDRPGLTDHITGGVLRLSDGSTVTVGALPDNGAPAVITIAPRAVSSVRFDITGVSIGDRNTGLAEIQAYATAAP